jgi:tol-pal system protein YbgF
MMATNVPVRLILLVFLVPLFGCATTGDIAYLRQDVDSLYRQLIDIQKEMKQVRSESSMTVRKSQADIDFMLEPLQREIQILKNAVEENKEFLQRPQQELASFRRDLEARLNVLEERLNKVRTDMDKLRTEVEIKLNEVAKASKAQAKREPPSAGEPPSQKAMEALYKNAMQTYERKEFAAAREQFKAFLTVYPKSDLSDNAQFWIGECFYSEKDYEKAIIAYDDVIRKYPKGTKVPAALLKQALCWLELGDKTFTRSLLTKIIKDYPASEQAKIAKDKLKGIK